MGRKPRLLTVRVYPPKLLVAMLADDPGQAQLERMASARLQPRAPSAPVMQGLGFSTDFTCRGRAMHNLTAEQARLAHSGRIGARLRRNSPVYYWQTTPQRRSRHEALCQKGSRWHLTTFGSHGKFEEKAKAKCESVGRLKHRVVHPRHVYANMPSGHPMHGYSTPQLEPSFQLCPGHQHHLGAREQVDS